MRRIVILLFWVCLPVLTMAQNVTIRAVNQPAATVFRTIMEQTGKNFVYSSELLKDVNITVNASKKPLKKVLSEMFSGTDIEYKIKGKNVILRRKEKKVAKLDKTRDAVPVVPTSTFSVDNANLLEEVVVVSRLEEPAVDTPEIGAKKLTATEIINTPVMFGESDVVKALQLQPGISAGAEGMAGMHVHGGNADENLFMLDNVPLYQVNHFGGLFSAFNADVIRYIDFFKSSTPAKYDGRLSSYLDVRTKNGTHDRHHGSFKLGLTSGSLFLEGPVGRKTTYMVGLRRSWFDVLSTLIVSAYNSSSHSDKIRFGYAFTDLNGKLVHNFSSRSSVFASVYFGNDYLRTGSKDKDANTSVWSEDEKFNLHWGNLVAQTGHNYRFSPELSSEFTAAYTRYFSGYRHDYKTREMSGPNIYETNSITKTDNNINDWIFRGDFDWNPNDNNRVRFGAGYTLHSFLPARTSRYYTDSITTVQTRDSTWAYRANEVNVYIEDDWRINGRFRVNAGFHGSLFNIGGKTYFGAGPRLSVSYKPDEAWAVKASYSRTNQYVHQLCQTYLSLPTDQWVPIGGKFKPQTADKVSVGGYWQTDNGIYNVSAEAYYKKMHNLVDYRDEYYLRPPFELWNARLCSGSGTAKGVDFKIEKVYGRLTGHVAYSLGWADRTFADKNGGHTFPARFDHRHTINILLNWNVSKSVQLNASWTGHSGNRFTFLPQSWEAPDFPHSMLWDEPALKAKINNYQLPFYHRLDLSCTVRNKRGFWNFSFYNAYCHMNTIAIRRTYDNDSRPVFQKVKMLPIIPSISYTWQF